MRFLLATLLTLTLCFIAGFYLPWWSIALVSFFVAVFVHQRVWLAFLAGFAAVFLFWGGLATVINTKNNGVLAEKIARLFPLNGNTLLLVLVTAVVGALVAGLAAMSGSSLRELSTLNEEKRLP